VSSEVSAYLDARTVAAGLVLLVAAAAAARPVARRLAVPWGQAYALVAAAGLLAVFTMLDRTGAVSSDVGRALTGWVRGWGRLPEVAFHGTGWWLNVALFVPAAGLWARAVRRPWIVLVGGVAVSALIETLQGIAALGALDPADLLANAVGTAVGVGLAGLWGTVRPTASGTRTSVRRSVTVGGAIAVAVLLVAVAIGGEADRRSDRLVARLRGTFGDRTSVDVRRLLEDPSGAGFASFLALDPVRADSVVTPGGTTDVVVRYPIRFWGASRCVFVVLAPAGPTFRQASGRACTQFRG